MTLLDRAKEKNLSNRVESVVTTGVINSTITKRMLRSVGNTMPISTNMHNKSLRHSNAGSPARQMSPADVKKYVGEKDGLLAMDLFLVQEFRTFENFEKHQLDENGRDYTIAAVKGSLVNSLKTHWRLYDATTGSVLLSLPYETEEILEAEGLNQNGVNVKLDSLNGNTIDYMMNKLVNQIKADFNPRQIKSNWMYFSKGDKRIERSGQYIKKGAFKKVISILEVNQGSSSKEKIKIRALYNLSTALFLDGQTDAAIKNIRTGLRKYNNKELKRLLTKMEAIR